MTAPTPDQLRIPQPEKPFPVNRDWLAKLTLITQRRCRRSDSGRDILRPAERGPAGRGGGFGSMLGGKMRALWEAGAAVLGEDNVWELTGHGDTLKQNADREYAATRVTAGK